MEKLEQLLNSLIEKGWKPFYGEIKSKWGTWGNYPQGGVIKIKKRTCFISYRYESRDERRTKRKKVQHPLRELVSKESGLWQFVCENGMVEEESFQYIEDKEICTSDEWKCYYNDDGYPRDNYYELDRTEAGFWIIESALKEESELESFILDNIKV